MRYPTFAALAGLALVALAACSDAASRLAAPAATSESQIAVPGQSPSLTTSGGGSQNGNDDKDKQDKDRDKENSCKADNDRNGDDKDGKSDKKDGKYSSSSSKSDKDKGDKDKDRDKNNNNDDENDDCGGSNGGGGTGTIKKMLVDVKTMGPGGTMPHDNTWTSGGPVTIPASETRWLFYRIDYSLPAGTTGTITEDVSSVCATAGAGIHCSFATPGPWTVKGTGSITVQIDLTNKSACDSRTFVNTAKLTPKGGSSSSASASAPLKLTCGTSTLTKKLVGVMKSGATPGSMIPDPAWTPGSSVVVIPIGETRWLDYDVTYTLPNGATGTITEDSRAVCATLGAFILQCSFNLAPTQTGVYSWSVSSPGGKITVPIDLGGGGGGSCGDHVFTNTAKLTPSVGSPVTASQDITVRVVCAPSSTIKKDLVRVWKAGATPGSMVPDLTWTPGSSIVVIPIGETRWLDYEVTYTLPAGVTGTITEDSNAVCATLGTFILQCAFNLAPTPTGVYSWSVSSPGGSITVPIDLGGGGGGSCGDHAFTNTAKLTPSAGSAVSASKSITVRVVCPRP